MPEPYAFIDNEFKKASEAKISILEPTVTKSDAVYDTLSVLDKKIFRFDDHLQRFKNSCADMEINIPHSDDEIKDIAIECIIRSKYKNAIFMLIGRRGPYSDLSKRDPRTCKNGLIVVVVPHYNIFGEEKTKNGLHISIVKNKRVPKEAIDARTKNFNWMDLNKGLLEAFKQGSDSAILCTPDGYLSEGPGFNMWIVKDRKLKTPKGNVLEGITRRSVFELAAMLGLKAEECYLEPKDLETADEAFACTTAAGITPITHVNNISLGNGHPGLLTERFLKMYWEEREKGWHGTDLSS
ncbi:MAG: aminotransferase class IV [Paracoccaceae bacterium]|nr:aminotransferase class IV [Paracoccaceae bacterium]